MTTWDQPDLFTDTTTDREYAPPTHIRPDMHGTTTGYQYGCRCTHCTRARTDYTRALRRGTRICKNCGTEYSRADTNAGGTKFCAPCIQGGVYQRNAPKNHRPERECARCANRYTDTEPRRPRRFNLCPPCAQHPVFQAMKSALGNHNAPMPLILAVIDWPYCANEQCGAWLLERAHHKRSDRSSARWTYNYAIDHDHECCPGERSCGECIRGIVCRSCNHAMPHTIDAIRARGLADYLAAHHP